MMTRIVLPLTLAVWLLAAAACTQDRESEAPHVPAGLTFTVSSAPSRAGGNVDVPAAERLIRSLWVYAFDDRYPASDYFSETAINGGQGVEDSYTVHMDIYDVGVKRFYVIANPPGYISVQLTRDCTEDRLKQLVLQLRKPLVDIAKLPQNVDGESNPGNTGFPMSNVVRVEAKLTGLDSHRMQLYVPSNESASAAAIETQVTSIPVLRSLGKITVQAYLLQNKDGDSSNEGDDTSNDTPADVAVTDLKLYNYTADGLFVPRWKQGASNWTNDGTWNTRNTGETLDLTAHAAFETKLITQAVQLFTSGSGTTDSGYIAAEYNAPTNAKTLHSFYLCQNSYDRRTPFGDQAASPPNVNEPEPIAEADEAGLPDVVGNRATRLVVTLSDGRVSETRLPYLLRNDHLRVRIGISKYAVRFEFLPWQLSTVNPDWSEETPTLNPQP